MVDYNYYSEFGQPDRMVMMYPPTYDEALRNDQPSQKPTFVSQYQVLW